MDLRQLRYSVAVAEERRFGRAAQRLRLSRPPLSMQIKALERTNRRVALTDAGRASLERARTILGAVEEAREVARASDRAPVFASLMALLAGKPRAPTR